jgi:hypothetical protein
MKKEHESKAVRIRRLILIEGASDATIAKTVKCHVSYVWQVRKKLEKDIDTDTRVNMDAHSSGVQFDTPKKEADALDHWENAVAPKSILDEAKDIIWGDREKTYGEPDVNLKRIATLWNAFLVSRYKHGYTGEPYEITSEDVCWMMVLLKASRQMNAPKRDNLVDAAGYIGLIERIQK